MIADVYHRGVTKARALLRAAAEPVLVVGSALAVLRSAARVAWLARRVPVLELPRHLRVAAPLPVILRDAGRLEAVAGRMLPFLPSAGLGPCLKRSLVLLELWSRCGREAVLRLGLRRSVSGAWQGHAWLSGAGSPAVAFDYVETATL